ncbi:MAG: CRISPR-associated endonuclease Cas1 [Gemmatimonadota bacterium]|nr:CRISPR-associated endonuclease Cas1 [Gemmatimonadota bacterium]
MTSLAETPVHNSTALGGSVVVLAGYGVRAELRGGHLEVESGVGANRHRQRFTRVSGLRRLIVLGDSGAVSLDALRWLYDTGAAFVHIGRDAHVVTVGSPYGVNDVRLRRAQALAAFTDTGLTVTRELLTMKLQGQLELLRRIENSAETRSVIEYALQALTAADDMTALRYAESRAAVAYWAALGEVSVRFVGKDQGRAPRHWRTVGGRQSILSNAPRKAVTPVHALLNYLYAILEAEAHLAAVAVGCDPELGILHSDKAGRSSFACDLMEPVRPHVDAFVLHLLETRSFLKSDFFETREGVCRVMPPLTEALAQTGADWAKRIAPIAERVAGLLAASADHELRLLGHAGTSAQAPRKPYRTPLTQRNRSKAGRSEMTRNQNWGDRGVPVSLTVALPSRCKECGADVPKRRAVCDECLKTYNERMSRRAVEVQAKRKAAGVIDKRSTDAVRAAHGEYARQQAVARRAWKAANAVTPNPQQFTEEIWSDLQGRTASELMAATGLSRAACGKILRGTVVPHPMHWDAFRSAVAGERSKD